MRDAAPGSQQVHAAGVLQQNAARPLSGPPTAAWHRLGLAIVALVSRLARRLRNGKPRLMVKEVPGRSPERPAWRSPSRGAPARRLLRMPIRA